MLLALNTPLSFHYKEEKKRKKKKLNSLTPDITF